ncbi:GFA family protein [Gilvimarinus sp. SDUM040013]|uniref:GFA family protein n=1 Tax=Gilvimarinus gilvus TaxID=3058038 RepID=A0ABU4RTJ2_9GAMM|nr:GFA family protein [Gilvimarinus sp. SDUM040013]MDO3386873.1 GFA family protein [Gilvimarinus sp. SDUM040013]MDX6848197.1 GFA family protein [Gilvimarinus sp. SDUM040013]
MKLDHAGSCSCGAVNFRVVADSLASYRCYCSICQKATGSEFSTTVLADEADFKWTAGQESVREYRKDSGYMLAFCGVCSSPVPNQFRGMPFYSVPAGAIEGAPQIDLRVTLFKPEADVSEAGNVEVTNFDEVPSLNVMFDLLGVTAP